MWVRRRPSASRGRQTDTCLVAAVASGAAATLLPRFWDSEVPKVLVNDPGAFWELSDLLIFLIFMFGNSH